MERCFDSCNEQRRPHIRHVEVQFRQTNHGIRFLQFVARFDDLGMGCSTQIRARSLECSAHIRTTPVLRHVELISVGSMPGDRKQLGLCAFGTQVAPGKDQAAKCQAKDEGISLNPLAVIVVEPETLTKRSYFNPQKYGPAFKQAGPIQGVRKRWARNTRTQRNKNQG
jgi:hypothetical protein